MVTKKCYICKESKSTEDFHKNKTKPDGLQNYCKKCSRDSILKEMICEKCAGPYTIKHRNVKKRKTSLCPKCLDEFVTERLVAGNKGRASDFIISTRGYKYLRDYEEKHGYKFYHRKAVEDFIGRKLLKSDVVHHIDGDRLNNEIDNLFLTNLKGHHKAHSSLDQIGYMLVRAGMIIFDKEKGEYKLAGEVGNDPT